ncbi:MAG TPA: BMP family ABC transporter substrate-binding protein [Caldilineae bacterium]|nr:BMP family ABC transporter substrate-binding protein [Caldilineae bacterium]
MTSCQNALPPPLPPATPDNEAAIYTHRVGILFENTDSEGNPLHQLAWQGAEDAADVFPVEITSLEIQHQTDPEPEIQRLVNQDYDLLIGIGAPLQQAIREVALVNPEQQFVLIDQTASEPNIWTIQFTMAPPSFLAGYLAAGVSANGVVCAYGGQDMPNVVDYLEGFADGVRSYNDQHSADVVVLGWDPDMQTGAVSASLQSSGEERQLILDYFEAGCDVFFPVTYTINLGLASVAQERELAVIGAGMDWFAAAPEFEQIWLTSVQKNLDQAMFDTIAALAHDQLNSGENYLGTLSNGGVGLASFHHWDDKIPNDLKTELALITQALIDQELAVGTGKGLD